MNTDYNKILKMFNSLMIDIKVLKTRQKNLLNRIRNSIESNKINNLKRDLNK